jgi:hypothetical protein
MGWIYRKSIKLGPVRINLSRSGVGYSVGAGGVRAGVRGGDSRRYTSVNVPGTGLRHAKSWSAASTSPVAVWLGVLVPVVAVIAIILWILR